MTLDFEQTNQFQKDFKLLRKQGISVESLKVAMQMIIDQTPLRPEHNNHLLSPKNQGNWECRIGGRNSDLLLVYKYYPSWHNPSLVVFTRVGTHSRIFR